MLKSILWKMCIMIPCFVLMSADSRASNGNDSTGLIKMLNDSSAISVSPKTSIDLHPEAEIFTEKYVEENRELLEKMKQKSAAYFSTFDEVFESYDMPVELKYLAVIESKLNTQAVSKVGAVGLWQFMPSTARIMGLKVNGNVDERKYKYKSTKAAARYLNDLYDIFNDWLLVIAAYNCGPARVQKAINLSGSGEFWKLQNYLPRETRLHVKKFISTHYFFEGRGSFVTMTKKETEHYRKALAQMNLPADPPAKERPAQPVYQSWVAVVHDEQLLKFLHKK